MPGFDSLLTSLSNGLNELTSGQGVGGLADKAKTTWNAQTPLTQGAVAGGLLAVLLSGNARRLMTTGAEIGGAALIGSLAMKAYRDWQAETATVSAAPAPGEDLSLRLLQAMVAAAKADDVITAEEHAALDVQISNLGLGPEAEAVIRTALDGALDAAGIAALAHTPQEAAGLYTASLLVVNRRGVTETAYLASLATALGLDAALVRPLEANVPSQA